MAIEAEFDALMHPDVNTVLGARIGQDARWAQALDAEFKVRAKPLFSPTARR